jgi:osmotically-inducible protein OsmY
VRSALGTEPGLEALSIDVNAVNGEVTLYGTADTAARRDKAAQVALNVDGVKSVTNHLIILKGS